MFAVKRQAEYLKNPSLCKLCKGPIQYQNRHGKYCNNSCAATVNNTIKPKRTRFKLDKRTENPKKYPHSRVAFINCPKTNKPYCSRNRDGSVRKCSPYISKTDKEKYYKATLFKFNVYNYPAEFNLNLILENGWYCCPSKFRKGTKNTNGVSRDHIFSVMDGFYNNIPPEVISHPANCQLSLHVDNLKKGRKSLISIDQLYEKIKSWDKKYKENERVTGIEPALTEDGNLSLYR